jgi:hypothetical protein
MRNIGEYPNVVEESTLWQILEVEVLPKYYLSETACRGILRRAATRGKDLAEKTPILLYALMEQGNITIAEAEKMGLKLSTR